VSARRDDECRAAREACLSIGGITFSIAADDPRLTSSREYDALRAFAVPPGPADVSVRACWLDSAPDIQGDLVFDSGGTWQLHRSGSDWLFTFQSAAGGAVPYEIARFDRTFSSGDVGLIRSHFEPGAAVYPLQYPLDELVMIHVLAQGRGIEVHGCALLDRAGRAFVFPGQSGAGKSTMARLWNGRTEVTLLSDERVIIRTDGRGLAVHGTPWHGDALLASPRSGELAAVYFLEHRTTHVIAPLARPAAAARLLACAFLPFHSAIAVDSTVASAERVACSVPCCALGFAPDRSVVDFLTPNMG